MLFMNFTAAMRKPNLIPFGLFQVGSDLSWISSAYGSPYQAIPVIGVQDGTNTVFALGGNTGGGSILVTVNGLTLTEGLHYTVSGSNITVVEPPEPDDVVTVRGGGNTPGGATAVNAVVVVPAGTKNGVNTTFTLPRATYNMALVFWNGIKLSQGSGYTINGATLVMSAAPAEDDTLEALVIP